MHHGDLPWEPATLQQRNGRAVRQGNTQAVIGIHHYISQGSIDLARLTIILGKLTWMKDIFGGAERETKNNPAAGSELSQDELVAFCTRTNQHLARPDGPEAEIEDRRAAATGVDAHQADLNTREARQVGCRAGTGRSRHAGTGQAASRDSLADLVLARHAPQGRARRLMLAPSSISSGARSRAGKRLVRSASSRWRSGSAPSLYRAETGRR